MEALSIVAFPQTDGSSLLDCGGHPGGLEESGPTWSHDPVVGHDLL